MTAPRPYPPLVDAGTLARGPALVVAPHPDDEVLGAGGVIAAHRDLGHPVTVAVLTDGSLGDPGGDAAGLAEQRIAESRAALERLGGAALVTVGIADGALLRERTKAAGELRALIDSVRPATVFFPSAFEYHPDHLAAALAVLDAVFGTVSPPRLLAYEIGATHPVNVLADITRFMVRKERAVLEFKSQLRHHDLVGKMRALARARTINVEDPQVRYAEAYLHLDPGLAQRHVELTLELLRLTDGPSRLAT